jgi:hypothetical protein
MADTVRLVDYFYITLSDRPGEGARALGGLKEAGVHLNAFHAFPAARRAQVDFVPSDPGALKKRRQDDEGVVRAQAIRQSGALRLCR